MTFSWRYILMTAAAIQLAFLSNTSLQAASVDPLTRDEITRNLPLVELETTQGTITVQLLPYAAPKACENFIALVQKGYYDNTLWHRIIPGFMIQGGDPTGTGRGGQSIWGKPFEDEIVKGLNFDKPGILAMANAGPNTNGSQFFITVAETPWLNGRHTIFGVVVQGYERVLELAKQGTQSGKPKSEQRILKARVIFEPTRPWESDNVLPQELQLSKPVTD